MLIRYHCIYYAIGLLLYVCAIYYHYLFFILFFCFLLFVFKRFNLCHVFLILCLSCLIQLKGDFFYEYPSHICGTVIKCADNYDYIRTKSCTIKLYNDYDFKYNDCVDVNVEYIDIKNNTNDYAFNEELYLKGQNIYVKAKLKSVVNVKHQRNLYHFIEERLSNNTSISSYQRMFVFGEVNSEIEDDYNTLSDLSLVHLFALSGMHISILYSILSQLFNFVLSKRLSKYLCYILIGLYVFSIPFSISLMRAFFSMVLYEIFKNYFNKLDVFGVLVIVSLLYNPYYIFNISFVFTYFIYFIVLLTKNFKNSFFYIYLSSLPIVLSINYEFSILSLFSADILTPFIEVFYTVICLSIIFPFLESVLLLCVSCLNNMIVFLNHVSLRFLVGKPNLSFLVLYYVIFILILIKKEQKKRTLTLMCILFSLVFSFSVYNRYKIYGDVSMIDVGQGDCTLIRLPLNRGNILIDTGGNKDYDIAKNTIIPYLKAIGIDHLDYVYISHDDFDHNGALISLTENFEVRQVISQYEKYRKISSMEVEMFDHSFSSESNDNSLIMRVKLPAMTILFMGDASISLEKELCDKEYDLTCDIIKIGHHGSSTSTSSMLLDKAKPSVAMIGVKENNIYKHPSQEVISRLQRKGVYILRTDRHGMFHIRYYNHKKYYIYE